ncbi:MAG: tetratricopeptide repeat protein [Bacteroidia bacterium]
MSVENLNEKRIVKLSKMITENPDDLFLKYALAMEYIGLNQKDKSIEILSEIIEKDQSYTAAYYQLGVLHYSDGSNQKALQFLKSGLDMAKVSGSNLKTINEFKSLIEEIEFET